MDGNTFPEFGIKAPNLNYIIFTLMLLTRVNKDEKKLYLGPKSR